MNVQLKMEAANIFAGIQLELITVLVNKVRHHMSRMFQGDHIKFQDSFYTRMATIAKKAAANTK